MTADRTLVLALIKSAGDLVRLTAFELLLPLAAAIRLAFVDLFCEFAMRWARPQQFHVNRRRELLPVAQVPAPLLEAWPAE